jgi:hypothetical protein
VVSLPLLAAKNAATSYGLTLVAGLPLPLVISEQVKCIQQSIDEAAPGRLEWYPTAHLHITLAALLRGRYRDGPPLAWRELPADLPGFVENLMGTFAHMAPFSVRLGCLHLNSDGILALEARDETGVRDQIVMRLCNYPELDLEKPSQDPLHVSIGYLCAPTVECSAEAPVEVLQCRLANISTRSIGAFAVDRVWLVHYSNRTLNRILGRMPFRLGHPRQVSVKHFLEALQIVTDA